MRWRLGAAALLIVALAAGCTGVFPATGSGSPIAPVKMATAPAGAGVRLSPTASNAAGPPPSIRCSPLQGSVQLPSCTTTQDASGIAVTCEGPCRLQAMGTQRSASADCGSANCVASAHCSMAGVCVATAAQLSPVPIGPASSPGTPLAPVPAGAQWVAVTNGAPDVRPSPTTNNVPIGQLGVGREVQVLGIIRDRAWCQIVWLGGRDEWVQCDLLSFTKGDPAMLPAVP